MSLGYPSIECFGPLNLVIKTPLNNPNANLALEQIQTNK